MLKVYDKSEKEAWNEIVKSFQNCDIYYLYEYAYSFMLHGDGDMHLIYFTYGEERLAYVVMQKDISNSNVFSDLLEAHVYYDWETPYGYGGPLVDEKLSIEAQQLFAKELKQYCRDHNIVSQFLRFHPLLKNFEMLPDLIETRYLRDTIFMDTEVDVDGIMLNMDSKNRNMVRKAIKNDVTIVKKDITDLDEFVQMYNETMAKHEADEYYTFGWEYFDYLAKMSNNACVFYAMYEGKAISSAIIYYNDQYAHYHLSGSHAEYRKYSPSNLLLYEAACWAHKNGIKQFHLGGGMAPDDSLFGFKKQFNKNGRVPFVVGRTIFNHDAYEKLLTLREKKDKTFNRNNGFMIQYRR